MTVRTTTTSTSRSSSRPANSASSGGTSATDSRTVPEGPSPANSGAGNQASRTVPSAATVATPTPEAEVTEQKATRLASTGVGLDLRGDPIALTAALVDIPSVSRDEQRIADEVEAALREQTSGFEIIRTGNTVLARTDHGLPSRVFLDEHLATVPIADNVPSRRSGGELHG